MLSPRERAAVATEHNNKRHQNICRPFHGLAVLTGEHPGANAGFMLSPTPQPYRQNRRSDSRVVKKVGPFSSSQKISPSAA